MQFLNHPITLNQVTLEANHTWTIIDKSVEVSAIGCKWVYKVKRNADGTLERYKARLVAHNLREFLDNVS